MSRAWTLKASDRLLGALLGTSVSPPTLCPRPWPRPRGASGPSGARGPSEPRLDIAEPEPSGDPSGDCDPMGEHRDDRDTGESGAPGLSGELCRVGAGLCTGLSTCREKSQ